MPGPYGSSFSNEIHHVVRACFAGPFLFFSNNKREVKTIAKQDLFINDEIRVREVRLIGFEGEQLGIKPLSEAQAKTKRCDRERSSFEPSD